MVDWRRLGAVFMAAAFLAGCSDEDGPFSPGRDLTQPPDAAQATLVCQVDLNAGSMACTPDSPTLPDGVSAAVLGGQGEYLLLESDNIAYDEAARIFSADVTVRNLLTQTLGTADGATIDPAGIRVFFVEPPATTGGTGEVMVANADGVETFVGSDSPYFQYDQALSPGKVSLPRSWQFSVPSTIVKFTFMVGVAAETADEEGVEPGLRFNARTISAAGINSSGLTLSGAAYCWGS